MHIGLREIALGFCALGFGGTAWFMRNAEFTALAWNALPYMLVAPLAFYGQAN